MSLPTLAAYFVGFFVLILVNEKKIYCKWYFILKFSNMKIISHASTDWKASETKILQSIWMDNDSRCYRFEKKSTTLKRRTITMFLELRGWKVFFVWILFTLHVRWKHIFIYFPFHDIQMNFTVTRTFLPSIQCFVWMVNILKSSTAGEIERKNDVNDVIALSTKHQFFFL